MASNEEPDEEKQVVCGVCEELLPGTYDGQAAAEEAADEHERTEHPDREPVVVVPVSRALVETEGADEMIETAIGAQQRLDEGNVGLSP
jgi:hypothetical protein